MQDAGTAPMQRAIALGETAMRRSAPNPWVGCVLVAPDGPAPEWTVVGEGASAVPGGPHAEVEALGVAGDRARGATAYVTLEPCSHHGRTPPCADALIASGVARVVVALEDPDPKVAGQGIARLRDAGVDVAVGTDALSDADVDAARRSLAPYLHQRRTGRAFVHAKLATSLDGRVAAGDGSPTWLTGVQARANAHELRAISQAVVVGAGTALVDHPSLTVRDAAPPAQPPLRVLLDSRGRVPAEGPLFDTSLAPTLVCTTKHASADAVRAWEDAGAEVAVLPAGEGGVDLDAVLELLGGRGVLRAMFEGGPTVIGALADAGLIDALTLYVAPVVLGDKALSAFGGFVGTDGDVDTRFGLVGTTQLGDDLRLDLERVDRAQANPPKGAPEPSVREAGTPPNSEAWPERQRSERQRAQPCDGGEAAKSGR